MAEKNEFMDSEPVDLNLDWEDPGDSVARLHDLRLHKIPQNQLYSVISDIADDRLIDAVPDIKSFLSDEDPELRYIALEVLSLNYRLPEAWQIASNFLEHDPNHNCRLLGALCLESLKKNTGDPQTLSILARVIYNTQEEMLVRESAYGAFRAVITYNYDEQEKILATTFNLERDVDWPLVASYLRVGEQE